VRAISVNVGSAPAGFENLGAIAIPDADGWWDVLLPIGGGLSPAGQYQITTLTVSDRYYRQDYGLPGTTITDGELPLTADQVKTAGGSAWDGWITVE
jgi:hypothetical protein